MIQPNELQRMYWDESMSMSEIAREIGVSKCTVRDWMEMYKIKRRTISESKLNGSVKLSKKELEKMYYDEKMSTTKIAELIGVSVTGVNGWMKSYKIEARTNSDSLLIKYCSSKPSKEELEKMYCAENMSTYEIAEILNVSFATVCNWMKSYKIEIVGNWKGGISFEPYCNKFNNKFKDAVRERDNYICQLCGHEQKSGGQKLDVHHIYYDKDNCYPDVVALCRSCHAKTTSGDRDYWEQYFENLLLERGLLNWNMGVQ